MADPSWRLTERPRELAEALEEHADLLLQQLGSEAVTSGLSDGEDSVAGQYFESCVDFAKIAARLAAYVIQTPSASPQPLSLSAGVQATMSPWCRLT